MWREAPRLALVGATGLVGRTTLQVLEEWRIRPAALRLFASDASAGQRVTHAGKVLEVEPLLDAPADVDLAIFATGAEISRQWVPRFRARGIVVIDHSSGFRQCREVPLVIPEVNRRDLAGHAGLIANPNCVTSILALPLKAFHDLAGLDTVMVASYQSVSGSGEGGLRELRGQLAGGGPAAPVVYPCPIAGNVIPQIGAFDMAGRSDEEIKMRDELRRILGTPALTVLGTAVRVPVEIGHCAAVTLRCARETSPGEVEEALRGMPGLVFDKEGYRTPREIAGRCDIHVSRVRRETGGWWQFWVAGDNLRKGAASNALQILLALGEDRWPTAPDPVASRRRELAGQA